MSQRTDLYSILYFYARKNDSPFLDPDLFISLLGRHASRVCEERPEWEKWAEETSVKVWRELNLLTEQGKVIVNSEEGNRIYLTQYYAEQVLEAYKNPDADMDRPFYDEQMLHLTIPHDQINYLDVTTGLSALLKEPQETVIPLIKLVFPGDLSEAMILASMIPLKILEIGMIKIRNHLIRHGNREYIQRKLAPQFQGKEDHLRDMLDRIQVRPLDCVRDMKEAGESTYYFWACFCNLMRTDLLKKSELFAEEIGVFQSIYIAEVCNSFFKSQASKVREAGIALRNFELEMEKPPYYFSQEAIALFKDNKGVPLLGQYSQEELNAYIKERTTEPAAADELPDLLFFHGKDGTVWLIKKNKVLPLCARFFAETRTLVVQTVSKRWRKLLENFFREPAMDDDGEFEKLISRYVEEFAPVLSMLLEDQRLYLIHEELLCSEKGLPESSRLFNRDELLPLRILLFIKRGEIISDIKLLLPFWYSIPVISDIIAFLKKLGTKKKPDKQEAEEPETPVKSPAPPDMMKLMQDSAREEASTFIPQGYTLESYLEELASRWGKLLDKRSKNNLVEDVNSLLRDRLRHILRFQRKTQIKKADFDKLAKNILENAPELNPIGEKNALCLYIKLYLIKLCLGKAKL
jgi:hypothetical protein